MYKYDKYLKSEKLVADITTGKDWGGRIAVGLIYPNSYYVGMSSLGFQTLYKMLNSFERVACERIFYEFPDKSAASGNKKELMSLESGRPLDQFDVLAFSVSYELDYFNVVQVLKNAGLPLKAEERDERHPLIIGGGPCIVANPEPLAPFFDCLAMGEGEPILPPLVALLESGLGIFKRPYLLKQLSLLPGIYVPLLQERKEVGRKWAGNLDRFATTSTILTPFTEFRNMYLVEVERGCNRGCKYCLAGSVFRPMRFRSVGMLLEQAEKGMKYTGSLGLVGASVLSHPDINELVKHIRQRGGRISFSSLAVDGLTDDIIKAVVESGTRTITLAPETGAEKLRYLCNKRISDDAFLKAVEKLAGYRIKQLKLYFMIGLPEETDADVEETIKLVTACQEIFLRKRSAVQIVLNVNPFIPKMGTAYQDRPMAEPEVLKERLKLLKQALSPRGIQVKAESIEWSQVQAILSTGDRRLAGVLSSLEKPTIPEWQKALETYNIRESP